MTESKDKVPEKESSKTEIAASKNKPAATKESEKIAAIKQIEAQELWKAFDKAFERFRNDFEASIFPSDLQRNLAANQIRIPVIDIEERENDYILRAEMPGFRKQDIVVNVEADGVEIAGEAGWKYDEKQQTYICKERACKSFYRYISLPGEIKIDQANASVCEGVLEIVLPKKAPKQKRKVEVK